MEQAKDLEEPVRSTSMDKELDIISQETDIEKAVQVLKGLPEDQQKILTRGMVAIQQSYSGPLPPAVEFKAYKAALESAPERIMSMAEKQQEHRITQEKKALKYDLVKTILGQVFAFILALVFGAGAIYLGIHGYTKSAIALGCTTVISLAAIFVLNRLPFFNKDEE